MKAILLAAGRGTRISRYIGESPKSTLDIGGMPLIKHTTQLLLDNGIAVTVVIGYKKEMVVNALQGLNVKYFYNPFYDVTNSIASLWFAKKELYSDDIIIANADVFWEQDILDVLLSDERDQVMLMDSSRNMDYLFKCDGVRLIAHGKQLKDFSGEYVGVAKIGRSFLAKFLARLETLIERQHHDLWWENVLYSFIDELEVNVKDISGMFWSEIDFIEDYNKIMEYRNREIERLQVIDSARK